ncbi:MAG: lipid-A-disaccharide synthase [Cyclobacteriaceae bacterium]
MKYFLVAGEQSGDQHGAELIKALTKLDQNSTFYGIGGEKMKGTGLKCLYNQSDLSFMGFSDVVLNLPKLLQIFNSTKNSILEIAPDVLILIDSAGFNLRLAKYASKANIKVVYFIPPKVWAWGRWRLKKLRKYIDEIIVLFPFEKEYFKNLGLKAHYFGSHQMALNLADRKINQVALLPGSRLQELKKMLPVFIKTATNNPNWEFKMCGIASIEREYYLETKYPPNLILVTDHTHEILAQSAAAVVTSGTATLEACLLRTPQVVTYKTSWLNYLLGRLLIQVKFISLVNLILDKHVVEELIQSQCTPQKITNELKRLTNSKKRDLLLTDYEKVIAKLGNERPYLKTAELAIKVAKQP